MRVTQNMLIRSNLSYISKNYERYAEIQDQINTNKKISRPSQDPVVAMKGMRYRSEVVEVKQFQRNLGEVYTWMDNADETLDETTDVLTRIKELTVQASNETYTADQRSGVAKEIRQLQSHLEALANTKINNVYIFNGTNTDGKPVDITNIDKNVADITTGAGSDFVVNYQGKQYKFDGETSSKVFVFKNENEELKIDNNEPKSITFDSDNTNATNEVAALKEEDIIVSRSDAISTNQQDFEIEVMKGIKIDVNVDPQKVYSAEMFKDISDLVKALEEPNQKASNINGFIGKIETHMDSVTAERADLGARYNRIEMIEQRLGQQEIVATQTMSDNEDIDFEKAIIDLTSQESLHRAALAMGARIIQPTLMDFLR